MKTSWQYLIAAAVIVGALGVLSLTGKKVPLIPANDKHTGILKQEDCSACHALGKPAPLSEKHPPKEQCLVCHKSA